MANVATGGRAKPPYFAHGERGKVVVEQEVAVALALEGLDLLLVGLGAQGSRHHGLRLAAREEGGAVGARQVGHLDADRPDLVDLAPVYPDASLHDQPADLGLLQILEDLAHRPNLVLLESQGRNDLLQDAAHRLGTRVLLLCLKRRLQLRADQLPDTCHQGLVPSGFRVEGPAGLPGTPDELFLGAGQPTALGVTEGDRVQHGLLGDLPGARLDHEDGVLRPGNDQLEGGDELLGVRRVDHELPIDEPHADRADRALEGNPRQAEGGRSAVHGEDVGVILVVTGDGQADHLDFVAERLGKERSNGPVDEPRGEDLLLDRRSLPLEVASGYASSGVRPFPVVDGQGEKVLSVPGALRGHAGRQDHRPAVPDDDGTIGLLGHLACFYREGMSIEIDRDGLTHTNGCPRGSAVSRQPPLVRSGMPAPGPPGFVRPRTSQTAQWDPLVTDGCRACRAGSDSARDPFPSGTRSGLAAFRST